MARQLTRTQWWLKEHQITAFWHGFGLSGGLQIPKEETKEIYTTRTGHYIGHPSVGGRVYIEINKEYMLGILKEYIKWLKSYKENWDTDIYDDSKVNNEAESIKDNEQFARPEIYEMIKLLQDINDSGKHLK